MLALVGVTEWEEVLLALAGDVKAGGYVALPVTLTVYPCRALQKLDREAF